MNNAMQLFSVLNDVSRRRAPETMAARMSESQDIALWVSDALAESAALRALLAECAEKPKQAKAIASRAADIPAMRDPRAVVRERNAQMAELQAGIAARIAADRAKAEKAERVRAAREALRRIELARQHEAELRRLVEEADGETRPEI